MIQRASYVLRPPIEYKDSATCLLYLLWRDESSLLCRLVSPLAGSALATPLSVRWPRERKERGRGRSVVLGGACSSAPLCS
eukprot:scaffold316059_cov15-Tisochrysis_lutea.AAC.1